MELPRCARLRTLQLVDPPADCHRSLRFLAKFQALQQCLASGGEEYVVALDADAVIVRRTEACDIEVALGGRPLGMAEQTGIRGCAIGRPELRDHYIAHSLRFIAPSANAPTLKRFRFFNSGFVVGCREEIERVTAWSLAAIARAPQHQVGDHMIADQDYLQYWANNLRPEQCATLSWEWNHCEQWDPSFPRPGARVMHFSNFCNGPTASTLARMTAARSGALTRWSWRSVLRCAREGLGRA